MFFRFLAAFLLLFAMAWGISESLEFASHKSQWFWLGWLGFIGCIAAYFFIIKRIFKGHFKFEDSSNWQPNRKE